MRKSFKITAIVLLAVVTLMVVLPMAFSGKLGDIVKREANAMLNCRVDLQNSTSLYLDTSQTSL